MLSIIQLAVFVCGGWLVVAAVTIRMEKSNIQKGVLSGRDAISSAFFSAGAMLIFFQSPIAKFLMTLLW